MTIPITAGEDPRYVGFRWWKVWRAANREVRYGGWFYPCTWAQDGWTEAEHAGAAGLSVHLGQCCPAFRPHESGIATEFGCGLHAWRTLAQAHGAHEKVQSYSTAGSEIITGAIGVMGIVKIAGRLVFHGGEGVRAQYARPVAFAVAHNEDVDPMLVELNERLGLPIFSVPEWGADVPNDLERFADEFGIRLPIRMGKEKAA